jgi:hypothetical protein
MEKHKWLELLLSTTAAATGSLTSVWFQRIYHSQWTLSYMLHINTGSSVFFITAEYTGNKIWARDSQPTAGSNVTSKCVWPCLVVVTVYSNS